MTKSNSLVKRITALILSVVFVLTAFAAVDFSNIAAIKANADESERFLMAYFTGNLQTEQQIKFAVSTDGSNFKPLYGGNAVLQEKSTDTHSFDGYTNTDGVRDPYIFKGGDDYYYCIATDLEATAYGFWGNQSQMVLWRSKDLINWSEPYYINVAQICNAKRGTSYTNSNFQRTWAPEVFYENGQYMVYFALAGGDYQATRMHYMITDDLFDWTHYSAPQVLYDPGYDDIDADIIKEGDTYYMFYKDETPGRSTVCLATATAMTGPYTYIAQFDTSSATGGIEGCEVYTVGNNYYLVADRFGAAGNFAIYNLGSSLEAVKNAANNEHISVTSSPISTVEELYGFTNLTPRHGSIMHISDAQYNALVAASGGVTDDDIMYNFTKTYSRTTDGWAYENGYADSSLHNVDFMFKENGSSVKIAHDAGYVTLRNATIFCNDETVRGMLPDDVYTISFDYALESTTNLSAPIFALGTGSGTPSPNTDYVMIFGNGDMYVRKSGESSDTFVANKTLSIGVTYHYDIVSDGTNIIFYRDGQQIGQIAATVDFPDTGTRYAAFGFTDGHSSAGYGYGSYSKIRFRDRAVSASEIQTESSKSLVYQINNGTETIDGKANAMNVSHSGNHNISEPIVSRNAASYSIAGWVNPGESVDYNSVMIAVGNGKWTPGPAGRYLAIREDGTILFNYCSGSNSGGNWSEHFVDINSAFSLSASTWVYLQVNIVPISDNQVKVVVFKDGIQTLAQDITLTTKVDGNNTNGNDYAYGILGMLQLPTNNIYLGRLEVPSWWQNENGTTYVKDVRFYAQAMDPDKLYETEAAKEYVAANIASYDVTASGKTFTAAAYHASDIATNGYNNLVYSPIDTSYWNTCAYDTSGNRNQNNDCGRVWYLGYKIPMPQNSVMVYDGVSGHTPAIPVQLEFKRFTSYGNYKTKVNKIYFAGTDRTGTNSNKFELNNYWYGFGTDYLQWYGDVYDDSNYEARNEDWKGKFGSKSNISDFETIHDGTNSMFWWNSLHYKGSGDSSKYFEKYSTLTFAVNSVSSYNWNSWTTEHIQNEGANVYVINYAPVYNALKNSGFTGVPRGENGTQGQSIKTLAMALSSDSDSEALYTTSSVDNMYYAAYKLMNCNPNSYSYSSGVENAVKECATDIKDAMDAFNSVNLQLRADFSALDSAFSEGEAKISELANGERSYNETLIQDLIDALDAAKAIAQLSDTVRKDVAATDAQSAINSQAEDIEDAIDALEAEGAAIDTSAYQSVKDTLANLDSDIYEYSDVTADSIIELLASIVEGADCTYISSDSVNYTVLTIKDSANMSVINSAISQGISSLNSHIKMYSITVVGDADVSFTLDGKDEKVGDTYYSTYNNTAVFSSDSSDTAWYMEYESSTTSRSKQYQGSGETYSTKVIGDMKIYAEKRSTDTPHKVSIQRDYRNGNLPVQSINYVADNAVFTLPEAPMILNYTFAGYYIGDNPIGNAGNTITVTDDVEIAARYTYVSSAGYSVVVKSTGGSDLYSNDSAVYNTKVTVSDSSAYGWVEKIAGTSDYRPFHQGSTLSFFVTEGTEIKAVATKAEYDSYYITLPVINIIQNGAKVETNGDKKKVYFNGQLLGDPTGTNVILEYGFLVGVPITSTPTQDELVLENSGTNDNYRIIRAKSTRLVGADQFTIAINGLSGNIRYRGYVTYQIGGQGGKIVTVYTDSVTQTIE